MRASCLSCGREMDITAFGEPVNLSCSSCGHSDFSFEFGISAIPLSGEAEVGGSEITKPGEPFYGVHKKGRVWKLSMIEIPSPPPLVKEETPPPVKEKVPPPPPPEMTRPKFGSKLKSRIKDV